MPAVRQGSRRKGLATVWASSFLFALCVLCSADVSRCESSLCRFVWLSVYNKGKTCDTQAIFHRLELMVGSWTRAKGISPQVRPSITALVYTDLDSIVMVYVLLICRPWWCCGRCWWPTGNWWGNASKFLGRVFLLSAPKYQFHTRSSNGEESRRSKGLGCGYRPRYNVWSWSE